MHNTVQFSNKRYFSSLFKIALLFFLFTTYSSAQVSFITNGQNIMSDNSWDIHLVDLNGDSIPDAYFDNKIWLNDGQGKFTKTNTGFDSGNYVDFGDLNGDGLADVVSNNIVYFNDGKFNFSDTIHLVSDIEMADQVLLDVDNDGDIDIISGGGAADRILLNDGHGNFTNSGKSLGGWGQCSYAAGDINNDGFTDIYVAIPHKPDPIYGHTPNLIWFGDGHGNFTSRNHDIPGAECRGVVLSDFNGDGIVDLYVSDALTTGSLWINDGTGNFTKSAQKPGNHPGPVKAADFNNDGYTDLFISQGDGNGVFGNGSAAVVWLNDGAGKFTDSGLRMQSGSYNGISMDAADINNDGRIDVVLANVKLDDSVSPPSAMQCRVDIWLNNKFSGNYLNQTPPGNIPLLFGSGTVSVDGENTHACTFSPDGSMMVFSRYPERKSYIMNCTNGEWSNPAEAFFTGKEVSFSPYGDKIFYYGNDGNIYYNTRTDSGWGNPIDAGNQINTGETEFYPSATFDGTLFFDRNGQWNQAKIYYSTYTNGRYNTPVDIGLPVNSGGALHAHIAPDKSYLLFNSPRAGSYTDLDIWISFAKPNNKWSEPINVGPIINSGADAVLCPKVTPDGKYMFFTKLNYNSNTGSIYWVSTNFIDSIKQTLTDVGKAESSKPINFLLLQNYPNPFNPSTTIKYNISEPSQIRLMIYNLLGQLVKILLNEFKNPGEYSADWNGTDNNSNQVSSGIYLCRLESDGMAVLNKMLLIR